MSKQLAAALDVLISTAREHYGDTDTTPASAYRFGVRPDGEALEIFKSPLSWCLVPIAPGVKE